MDLMVLAFSEFVQQQFNAKNNKTRGITERQTFGFQLQLLDQSALEFCIVGQLSEHAMLKKPRFKKQHFIVKYILEC
jgi:hypothetical protein